MNEAPLLGNRYELGEVLGRGGMAEVRQGRDLRLGRIIAVKMLRTDLAGDPTFQARFRREAQSAASLNHPSIVAVYDTGEDTLAGGHVPYIVMEHVEGKTLRDLLREHQRITPERALEVTSGILEALDYSHRAGIIHRDIKPANVMLTRSGDVKVMDFGIARTLTDAGATVTQTASVVGTAQYISPEQARGEQADARSDLYATGCVLYELLTGRPPFLGDTLVSVAVSHVREQPEPPSRHDPTISADIDAVVLKALAKDRAERYQSAAEMRADVERAAAGLPVEAAAANMSTQLLPPVTAAAAPTASVPVVAESEGGRRWGWGTLITAVIAVLGLAALLGYLALRDTPTTQVRVPSVVDQTEEQARAALAERDLVVAEPVEQEDSTDVDPGTVLRQSPDPNTLVDTGSEVELVVARSPEEVTVPAVRGQTLEQARAALEDADLAVGNIDEQDSDQPQNTVLSTSPPGGESVAPGTTVNLVVSNGQVAVPDVQGRSRAEAEALLDQAGFDVSVREEVNAEAAPDTVLFQTPAGGGSAPRGSRVVITVAIAPPAQESPPPTTPTTAPAPEPAPAPAPAPAG